MRERVCVCVCVRACVRACVRVCVHIAVPAGGQAGERQHPSPKYRGTRPGCAPPRAPRGTRYPRAPCRAPRRGVARRACPGLPQWATTVGTCVCIYVARCSRSYSVCGSVPGRCRAAGAPPRYRGQSAEAKANKKPCSRSLTFSSLPSLSASNAGLRPLQIPPPPSARWALAACVRPSVRPPASLRSRIP